MPVAQTVAECLGLEDKAGTLENGKLADNIISKGNPLEDIYALANKDTIELKATQKIHRKGWIFLY